MKHSEIYRFHAVPGEGNSSSEEYSYEEDLPVIMPDSPVHIKELDESANAEPSEKPDKLPAAPEQQSAAGSEAVVPFQQSAPEWNAYHKELPCFVS